MYMAVFMQKNTVKKMIALLMAVAFLLVNDYSVLAENEECKIDERLLYSKSCVLMDGESGRVLYGREADVPLANASTTKILTCILVLENCAMDEVVTATKKAASQPKVRLGMRDGEQFYVKDLLYAMMLESFNDCAMALAEHAAGSVEDFSKMMNSKSEEIGCTNSYFVTPNGLDAETDTDFHHSTAEDLCRIMKYCCWESQKCADFLTITQTPTYGFCNLSGKNYAVTNHNAFLNYMDEAISGKTGFTSKAGYCYVAAIESKGRKYCIALLACGWPNHKTYKWNDATLLFTYGMEHFSLEKKVYATELPPIVIVHGRGEGDSLDDWGSRAYILPQMQEGEEESLLVREDEELTYRVEMPEKIYREIDRNEMVGKIYCYLNDECVGERIIVAKEGCRLWNFTYFLQCFMKSYLEM